MRSTLLLLSLSLLAPVTAAERPAAAPAAAAKATLAAGTYESTVNEAASAGRWKVDLQPAKS